MIQPLRRIHRIVIPLLLLLIAAAAMLARMSSSASVVMPALPDELAGLQRR
jgi:hypothetical protein